MSALLGMSLGGSRHGGTRAGKAFSSRRSHKFVPKLGVSENMNIRPYQDSDRLAVIALWEDTGLAVPQNDPGKDIDRKMEVDPDLFLVGECEGEIVATVMAGYEGHRGWINYLAVKPSHQRNGYGRTLMREAEHL